ncbi:unnamed protein product [Arctia plantaginis]|uniref:Glycine-rich protein n=1 Tax=Arctia plantaginis TaxID=874455 RepID=A0A8S0ZF45_ARCPL|nr:unnamed protein product [Arctia plantaginis]
MLSSKRLFILGVLTALTATISAQGFRAPGSRGGTSYGGFGSGLLGGSGSGNGFGNLGFGNSEGSGGLGQGGFGNFQEVFSNLQKRLGDMLGRFRSGLGF